MSQSNRFHTVGRLIAPSSASVISAMFISMLTVAITMYYTVYKGSMLEEYGRQLAQEQNNYRAQLDFLFSTVNSSEFASTAYMIVIWCAFAVVFFAICIAVFHIVRGGAMFVGNLRFLSEGDRPQLLIAVAERLFLRLLGAAGLFGVYQLTLLGAVPILYTLQQLKIQPAILSATASVAVTIIITMVLVHLSTIVLRLLTLRVRLFF